MNTCNWGEPERAPHLSVVVHTSVRWSVRHSVIILLVCSFRKNSIISHAKNNN